MNPLPGPLGSGEVLAWRLDQERYSATWNSGEGAYLFGGRWNSPGVRVVYCAIDPSTAILEVAVHKTFRVLDTMPHVLSAMKIHEPATIHVVERDAVPNANWLRPGIPGAGQQEFGDALLAEHPFILIPSAVSTFSWNLLVNGVTAEGAYSRVLQERFALDTRLHPSRTALHPGGKDDGRTASAEKPMTGSPNVRP